MRRHGAPRCWLPMFRNPCASSCLVYSLFLHVSFPATCFGSSEFFWLYN
jgi:hypothetical protein